jgi:hypothetical protein
VSENGCSHESDWNGHSINQKGAASLVLMVITVRNVAALF